MMRGSDGVRDEREKGETAGGGLIVGIVDGGDCGELTDGGCLEGRVEGDGDGGDDGRDEGD